MSKFRFESEGDWLVRYDGDRLVEKFTPAALQEFATAAQAALAEQNSGVVGGTKTCYCELDPNESSICDEPDYGGDFTTSAVCQNCDHDFACHQPQAQRREA